MCGISVLRRGMQLRESGRGKKNLSLFDGLMISAVVTTLVRGSPLLTEQARWLAAVI